MKSVVTRLPDGGTRMAYKGLRGEVCLYPLFPGVGLLYISIRSSHWPNEPVPGAGTNNPAEVALGTFLLNYAMEGSCKIKFAEDQYLLQQTGDLSLSSHIASDDFFYPDGYYRGLEFFVYESADKDAGLAPFGIDFSKIYETYKLDGPTCIGACPELYKEHLSNLWTLLSAPAAEERNQTLLPRLRAETIQLFQDLQFADTRFDEKQRPVFHAQELQATDRATRLILEDLQTTWTVERLAETLGAGPSTLKRHFQKIYGMSVAKFQRKKRMEYAAELLVEYPSRSVLDIALEVGYENQSKFAAAFKREYGRSPLEYRQHRLFLPE